MKATLFYKPGQAHQLRAMSCAASGLAEHGISATVSPDDSYPAADDDFVVTWGYKRQYGFPQLVLEAGYINGQSGDYVQSRLQFVSTGWNGLHGRADPDPLDCPPDRAKAFLPTIHSWRKGGDYVLVCDQHPGDACAPPAGWWREARGKFHHDLLYRPHPLLAPDLRPLSEALENAAACLTWSSTAAVESVLAGVPTWALDPGSPAWDVAAHHMEAPPYTGERVTWLSRLAYRQWTHEELESGLYWHHLKHGL